MKKTLFCLLGMISVSIFADNIDNSLNYQERGIYYGEDDNVCNNQNGSDADSVVLDIKLPNGSLKQYTTRGSTGCNGWSSPFSSSISAFKSFSYAAPGNNGNTYIPFDEETTKTKNRLNKLASIVQKTTVDNPVQIDRKKYNCSILGSGKVEHYGYSGYKYPPVVITMVCDNAN